MNKAILFPLAIVVPAVSFISCAPAPAPYPVVVRNYHYKEVAAPKPAKPAPTVIYTRPAPTPQRKYYDPNYGSSSYGRTYTASPESFRATTTPN